MLSKADDLLEGGKAISNQLKAFGEKTELPKEGRNFASKLPLDLSCNITFPGSPVCPAEFRLASPTVV